MLTKLLLGTLLLGIRKSLAIWVSLVSTSMKGLVSPKDAHSVSFSPVLDYPHCWVEYFIFKLYLYVIRRIFSRVRDLGFIQGIEQVSAVIADS